METVTDREEEALRLLDSGGDYGDIIETYDNGAEIIESLDEKELVTESDNGVKAALSSKAQVYLSRQGENSWQDAFPDLNENEALTLYGTLAGVSRQELAESLDVSGPTVSNYRNELVDSDYLRNLRPGRGPSEYIPGAEVIDMFENYSPEPKFLEGLDAAEPFSEEEDVRWLIGEDLYQLTQEQSIADFEEEVVDEDQGEQAESHDEPGLDHERFESTQAALLLDLVDDGEGFGVISDRVEDAHELSEHLEEIEFVEEDRDSFSGLEVTERGQEYLESATIAEKDGNSSKSSRSSSSRTRSSRNGSSSDTEADKDLQDLGDELLDGHEETWEQQEDRKRDFTDDEETEEVDIEDDNAGYEGFT